MALAALVAQLPAGRELTAFLVVVCFTAGLNVYATVLVLGLLSHANLLVLPPQLGALANWYILSACGGLFLLEFVGDKVPVFDLLWNAMHTFIRVPLAGLIAYAATSQLPEGERLAATLVGALIALAAHGGKSAARAAVTPSPEPFSNTALSLGEDAGVALLLWFAAHHPFAAATIVVVALGLIALMAHQVLRALKNLFGAGENALVRNSHAAH